MSIANVPLRDETINVILKRYFLVYFCVFFFIKKNGGFFSPCPFWVTGSLHEGHVLESPFDHLGPRFGVAILNLSLFCKVCNSKPLEILTHLIHSIIIGSTESESVGALF